MSNKHLVNSAFDGDETFVFASFLLPSSSHSLPLLVDFVGDETVLSGLEVGLVQAGSTVDHLLVLRGPLPVVLSTACAGLVRVWVLQDLGDVHLLRWRENSQKQLSLFVIKNIYGKQDYLCSFNINV